MNAIQLLKSQHAEVKRLFHKFERAQDEEDKRSVFEQIADELAAHSEIEEKLFYPAVCVDNLQEELEEAVEEHLSIKRLISDLLELNAADESFRTKIRVLREQVEHHVEEEEGELFPRIKNNFEASELEILGAEMETMFKLVPTRVEAAPIE